MGQMREKVESVPGVTPSPMIRELADQVDQLNERISWLEGCAAMSEQYVGSRLSRFEAAAEKILQRLPPRPH